MLFTIIFIPRLNMQLDSFRNSYAHHRMRTAGNQSPFQLWTKGLIENSGDESALNGLREEDLVILMCFYLATV